MTLFAPPLFSDDDEEPMDTDAPDVINFLQNVPPTFQQHDPEAVVRDMLQRKKEIQEKWKTSVYDLPGISSKRKKVKFRSAFDSLHEKPKNEADRMDLRNFYSSFLNVPTTSHSAPMTKEERQRQREKALKALTDADRRGMKRVFFSPKPGNKNKRRREEIPICLQGSLSTEETRFVTDTVEQLGGIIVSDIEKATCFVAKEVRISTKFLCAIGKHIPIVSMDWVRESKAQGRLLKGTDYLLKDKEQEEKLNICIERVVNMEVPFLQKWVICCLPGVKPGPSDVAKLTRCCGGIFVDNMRHLKSDKNVILVTKKDDLTHAEKEMIREAKRRKFYRIECRRFFALVGRQSRKAFEAALSH